LFTKTKSKYLYAGYPLQELDKFCNAKWAASPKREYQQKPYVAFLPYLGPISEQIISFLEHYNIRTVSAPANSLKQMLTPKSSVATHPPRKEYVYALPCSGCTKSYIGHSSRGYTRLQEHLRDVKNNKLTSAPAAHHQQTGHEPAARSFFPLFYEKHLTSRLNIETFTIHLLKDDIINNIIPTHFGIQSWLKYLKKNQEANYKKMQAQLKKLISAKVNEKQKIRQFILPALPSVEHKKKK
jgi:hypothetical protein